MSVECEPNPEPEPWNVNGNCVKGENRELVCSRMCAVCIGVCPKGRCVQGRQVIQNNQPKEPCVVCVGMMSYVCGICVAELEKNCGNVSV